MRKRLAGLLILLLFLAPVSLAEPDALLYNGDFSLRVQDEPLPAGWYFESWDPEAPSGAYMEDGALVLASVSENDARVCQRVAVEPDTLYRITCQAEAEDVWGNAGASVAVLDTFAASEQLYGGEGMTVLSLTGRTGPDQTELVVALRLGGYGALASGTARFRNAAMERLDAAPAGAEVFDFTPLEANADGAEAAPEDEPGPAVFLAYIALAVLSGAGYWLVYRREIADHVPKAARLPMQEVLALLAAAVLVRLLLSLLFTGHATDLSCFMAWADAMAEYGPSGFYHSVSFADYPPGYMYVLWLLGEIRRLFDIPYGSPVYVFLIKAPAIAAELFTAYFACRFAVRRGAQGRKALLVFALLAFQPAFAFLSGGWGQIDSILALCLLFVLLFFQQNRRILAGALYGLAILIKPQALMLGPLLAFAYLSTLPGRILNDWGARKNREGTAAGPTALWKREPFPTVLAVLAAFAVILLLSLPFSPEPGFGWLLEKYFSTATSYPYASVEAYNLFALFGGNWAPVGDSFLLLSYGFSGAAGILLSVAGACVLYAKSHRAGERSPGPLLLAGAFLIAGAFTLGHYMHERYLYPALVLLFFACLSYDDRRLFIAFAWLSTTLLLNAMGSFLIVDHQYLRGTGYELYTRFCSLCTVLGFAYLCRIAYDIGILGRRRATALLRVRDADGSEPEDPPKTARPPLPPLEPLDFESGRKRLRFGKWDHICCWALTGVYAIVSLVNLGSLEAPESYYYSIEPGQEAVIRFEEPVTLSEYWVFGGIGSGSVLLLTDQGNQAVLEQSYDEMYRWAVKDAAGLGTVRTLSLTSLGGEVWLNEIAFFDQQGRPVLPAAVEGPDAAPSARSPELSQSGGAAALIDEPGTVPEYPSYFNGMYFDELYHARTAYEHLHGIEPYEISHPPLGKVFIMLGIALFGMTPFGWRVAGALFGIAMTPLLYAFARRLFGRTDYAFLAAGLFTFDFMHFTQTRIATIDGFSVFFILLMFYFMYDYYTMSFYEDGLRATLKPLALAGLAFGLGAATKWICIYAGAGLAVILFLSLFQRWREYREAAPERKVGMRFTRNTVQTLAWCCVFYIAVPACIYLLSYLPHVLSEAQYGLREILENQEYMWSYHSGLEATHPYQSAWWEWPFTLRPMWYCLSEHVPEGLLSTMSASGNPAVWWVSAIGAAALAAGCALRRIPMRPGMAVVFVGVCANYLPWVLVSRCTFIYHFFATVPFILLAAVYLLVHLEERRQLPGWVKFAWLSAAILMFASLYPGISGLPVPVEWAEFLRRLPGGQLMYGA